MKILSLPPDAEHPKVERIIATWWIGRVCACGVCPCRFRLEEGDTVRVRPEIFEPDVQVAYVLCPSCRVMHQFRSDEPENDGFDDDPF